MYQNKNTPEAERFENTIRVKNVGRVERRAKVAKPVSNFRVVSSRESDLGLLKLFAKSYATLTRKKGWTAPDIVEAQV